MNIGTKTIPVSVIIPCYQCASTIARAVESVLAQTQLPTEIILVDDASDADTQAVLYALTNTYNKLIKLVRQDQNTGAGQARNTGWELATQPYIAFLDADDAWHSHKLEIQYTYMQQHPAIVLSGHPCTVVSEEGSEQNITKIPTPVEALLLKKSSLLFRCPFGTPSAMLKRDIPFRFQPNKHFAEDYFLWQQIAFSDLGIAKINLPLASVYKLFYGAGGLSKNLYAMEREELQNFTNLYQAKRISLPLHMAAIGFSLLKFTKRILVTTIRQLSG